MNNEAKYELMRKALRAEMQDARKHGYKHQAAALSELLLSGMPRLVALFNRIDDAANERLPRENGIYYEHQQSEPVHFYPEEGVIR